MPTFPARVSPNGRYFLDNSNQPFFWLGDTAWPLFTRYAPNEAETYLQNRARKGFNVVQCVLAWPIHTQGQARAPIANLAGELPWLDHDPSQPNPAYFESVDHIVQFAAEQGITLAILPTWGNLVTDVPLLNAQNASSYGTWLGARYRDAPNLIWVNGGDCLPHGYENVFNALAQGLRAGDGGRHLISYHPCGWYSSSHYFHHADWLDFNMIQTWTDWHKTYEGIITDSLLTPAKPVVLAEGAYEDGPEYPRGSPISPLNVRKQAWWAFMAGGYYTYGQNQMWRVEPGWLDTLDTPGAEQMGLMKAIVSRYPWWQRVPDQGLIEQGQGEGESLNTAVRDLQGQWAMVYLSGRSHILLRLGKLAPAHVKATWINPATGEQKEGGVYSVYELLNTRAVRRANFHWFATPDHWDDAVLLLDSLAE